MRYPCGDRNGLYLHCINANVLVVILPYSVTRCHCWEKLDKGDLGPLCTISHAAF